jgi:hypothetical protein
MAQSPYLDQNAPEILALERQKKLADLLQARALEQPQGQMVSGRYVAPSIIQQLAPLANAYMGRKASEDVESRQSKLANLIRGQQTEQANKFTDLMYGKAGTPDVEAMPETITTPTGERVAPSATGSRDDMGNLLPNFAVNPAQEAVKGTATKGNLLEALKFAQSTGNPALVAQVQEQLKPFTLTENAIRRQFNPVTNQYETIGEGNIKKEKETFPPDIKSAGMKLGFGTDPSKYNAQQLEAIDKKIQADEIEKRKAGASPVTFNPSVNMGKSIISEVGPILTKSMEQAENAVKQIDTSNRLIGAIDSNKVFTGTGANVKVALTQVGDALGIAGKDSQEKLANTRIAIQSLAQLTLQGRQQMRGEGAITQGESNLAEQAMSGKIDFTSAELRILANAAKRAAEYTYKQHESRLDVLRKDPNTSGVVPIYSVPPMPDPNQWKVIR